MGRRGKLGIHGTGAVQTQKLVTLRGLSALEERGAKGPTAWLSTTDAVRRNKAELLHAVERPYHWKGGRHQMVSATSNVN
jgi:hypothetical protein